MQPMRSRVMEWRGLPCFLVGGDWGFFFQVVFGVESGLFTFHLDSGLYIQAFCFCLGGRGGVGGFKAKSSQVSDMFPQRAPKFLTCAPKSSQVSDLFLKFNSNLSHILWQMLPSFYLHKSAKGEEFCTSKQNLLCWVPSTVSYFWVMGQSNWKNIKLNLGGTSPNE
jgi:hypothetical protein